MTQPEPYVVPARVDGRTLRDVCALLLIVLGLIGLAVVLWQVDPLALAAYVCLLAVAGGVALGTER